MSILLELSECFVSPKITATAGLSAEEDEDDEEEEEEEEEDDDEEEDEDDEEEEEEEEGERLEERDGSSFKLNISIPSLILISLLLHLFVKILYNHKVEEEEEDDCKLFWSVILLLPDKITDR